MFAHTGTNILSTPFLGGIEGGRLSSWRSLLVVNCIVILKAMMIVIGAQNMKRLGLFCQQMNKCKHCVIFNEPLGE